MWQQGYRWLFAPVAETIQSAGLRCLLLGASAVVWLQCGFAQIFKILCSGSCVYMAAAHSDDGNVQGIYVTICDGYFYNF